MTGFDAPDLVPLWDRPTDFLPQRPPSGEHRWQFESVRRELKRIAAEVPKAHAERRVALLSHPGMPAGVATDGLNAGIQLLLPGESADPHRHSPTAVRVGLQASGVVTTVDDEEYLLDPLDVVLNPSWTWHGHHADPGAEGGFWLDVVDLPLVAALGGTLFEPAGVAGSDTQSDSSGPGREPIRYPWSQAQTALWSSAPVDGVHTLEYGADAITTMAVTAYGLEAGACARFPPRTGGALLLAAEGRHLVGHDELAQYDVVALRAWTPCEVTCIDGPGVILCIDTSPALRRLGVYREQSR